MLGDDGNASLSEIFAQVGVPPIGIRDALPVAGSVSLGGVRGETVGQLARAAEADVMAAVHLVGVDA
jgi:hypothetical protein